MKKMILGFLMISILLAGCQSEKDKQFAVQASKVSKQTIANVKAKQVTSSYTVNDKNFLAQATSLLQFFHTDINRFTSLTQKANDQRLFENKDGWFDDMRTTLQDIKGDVGMFRTLPKPNDPKLQTYYIALAGVSDGLDFITTNYLLSLENTDSGLSNQCALALKQAIQSLNDIPSN